MSNSEAKKLDFDNPSNWFKLENKLMWFIGGPLLYDRFIRTFELDGTENVLDFGCGGGVGSKAVLKYLNRDGHLTCLDTSKYWINVIRKRLQKHKNVSIMLGDIRELEIPRSTFDLAFMVYVLHDIDQKIRQDTTIALGQKLKQNGRLFIAEPTESRHGIPIKEIQTLFEKAGFIEKNQRLNGTRYIGEFKKIMKK
jgi:ubiquinone/menaquinone biosynthesis C-methylase UbiE